MENVKALKDEEIDQVSGGVRIPATLPDTVRTFYLKKKQEPGSAGPLAGAPAIDSDDHDLGTKQRMKI